MSYSCFISFKNMEAKDIYPFFQNLKKTALERMEDISKENYLYCPYLRDTVGILKLDNIPEDFSKTSRVQRKEAINWVTSHVFTYKYFYREDLKLLGVFGIPTTLYDLFDKTVHFQNSCDQNYERKSWEGIKLFEDIYDKWMDVSEEELIKIYDNECSYNDFKKEYEGDGYQEKVLYYRQSNCYAEIWNEFEEFLYNDDTAVYLALLGARDIMHALCFVKHCHIRYLEWCKQVERETQINRELVEHDIAYMIKDKDGYKYVYEKYENGVAVYRRLNNVSEQENEKLFYISDLPGFEIVTRYI